MLEGWTEELEGGTEELDAGTDLDGGMEYLAIYEVH